MGAIQALKPNNATRLEQPANEITSLTLSVTTASEYVSAHRAANTTFLSIDPTHHYLNPQTYLQRILAGLISSPHLAALILHHRNSSHVSTTLINTIFSDIIDATPDNQPIAASTRHHHPNYSSNHNKNRNNNRNSNRNNSANRFGRGPGFPGVKYACMRCKKDNHTDADCSFKDSATSQIAHQVQVQVAAALAPYLPTHSEIKQSDVVDQYTTLPSRILLDSAASTSMAPDTHHHHSTARSRTLVTVANANTTRATAIGPATLPTFPTATTLEVLVVPGIRDTLLAASHVAKSSDILIQQDEVCIIPKASRPDRDSIRTLGKLRNGVYEMQVPAASHAQEKTRNVHANMTQITSTLHDTFNHAPAITLRRIAKHYPTTTAKLNALQAPPMTTLQAAHTANKHEHHYPQSSAQHRHHLMSSAPTPPGLYHEVKTTPDICSSFTTAPPVTSSPSHSLQSPPPLPQYTMQLPAFNSKPAAPSVDTMPTLRANNTRNLYARSCSVKGQK
jgi:hypothetical protein